jgi:hypothetical protein
MVFFLGLVCLVGGVIAVLPLFTEKHPRLAAFDEKLTPYKIIVGLVVLIIGVIRLIVPFHRSGGSPFIPVFGDLIPAALAILLGILVSIEFLEGVKGFKGKFSASLKETLHTYQYPIGFGGIVFGILHWFLFWVVFL